MVDGEDGTVLVELPHLGTRHAPGRHPVLGPGYLQGGVPPVDRTLHRDPLPEGQVTTHHEGTQLGRHCGGGQVTPGQPCLHLSNYYL